jgi:hypothetical protein
VTTNLVLVALCFTGCDLNETITTTIALSFFGYVLFRTWVAPLLGIMRMRRSYSDAHARMQAAAIGLTLPDGFNRGLFEGEYTFACVDPMPAAAGLSYPASLNPSSRFLTHIQTDRGCPLSIASNDQRLALLASQSTAFETALRRLLNVCHSFRLTPRGISIQRSGTGGWMPESHAERWQEIDAVIRGTRTALSMQSAGDHALLTRAIETSQPRGETDPLALAFAIEVADGAVVEYQGYYYGDIEQCPFCVYSTDSVSIRVDLGARIGQARLTAATTLPLRMSPKQSGSEVEMTFVAGAPNLPGRTEICMILGLPYESPAAQSTSRSQVVENGFGED